MWGRCLKCEHPASQTMKNQRGVVTYEHWLTSPKLTFKHRKQSPKNKAPCRTLQDMAGCLPDEPSEEGVRLSRTGNSNLTT